MAVKHVIDPIARLAEREVVKFISDALRAGQRAILVTGRSQVSMRVPEAALAACASASARALHIGPPLPEPPELQEMIGASVEIAGGREMIPQAMARLLLFADPRPTVILAIDDAHTLSHRSLSYLTLMTELLAPEAPILQIVLAAGPALLDTLAQPEFERLRNLLGRPGFETFQTLHGGRANGAFSGLRKPAHGGAAAGVAHVQHADPAAASPRGHGIARPAVYAAGGVVAIGCLTAIGYVAFSAFTVGPTLPPIPSLNSAAEQLGAAGDGDRAALSLNAAAPAPPIAAPDQNVDAAPPAILAKAAPTAPDGAVALSAEQLDAAGNGDRAALPPNAAARAPPIAAREGALDFFPVATVQSRYNFADRAAPTAPDGAAALSAEQLGATGDGDRAALSPNPAAPALPIAAPDQNVDAAPPAILAKAAPTAPDGAAALSAEQLGATGNGDRAALSPNPAAPALPIAAPDQNVDAAPAILAKAAPTAPDGAAVPSAEQLGAAGNGDRAPLSSTAAAPAPPIAAPDQNVDAAPAILAKAAPTAPDGSAVPSAEQLGAAGNGDRAALSSSAAAPAPPIAAPDQNVDAAPAILAKAAPTAPDGSAARV